MFALLVTAALVFLPGSESMLPDVGSCTYMGYFCDARKCDTDFIKKLQKDPEANCSVMFDNYVTCVKSTITNCTKDKVDDSVFDAILSQMGMSETTMCSSGSLVVPTIPPALASGMPCSSSFTVGANNCLKHFRQKFAANKSDPSLCMENAKAKKCVKNLLEYNCTFPEIIQKMFDTSLNDYNPYCANNRDPGATGNDQCHDVNRNPTSATAGHKYSVVQALLFSLLLLIFFVKQSTNQIFSM